MFIWKTFMSLQVTHFCQLFLKYCNTFFFSLSFWNYLGSAPHLGIFSYGKSSISNNDPSEQIPHEWYLALN